MERCGLRLVSGMDSFAWSLNTQKGIITASVVYDSIVTSSCPPLGSKLYDFIWNGTLPKKISCFVWLAVSNKLLTWDNLQRRGWIGPSVCALCLTDQDCTGNLFGFFPVWLNLLLILSEQYHLEPTIQSVSLVDLLGKWIDSFSKYNICCYLPFFTMWVLWNARNKSIFEGYKLSVLGLI